MNFLFEYRKVEGKDTYLPYKCLRELKNVDYINASGNLRIRLSKLGFMHVLQNYNSKMLYVNIENKNVINSGNYIKILELIKKYKREYNLNKLLTMMS